MTDKEQILKLFAKVDTKITEYTGVIDSDNSKYIVLTIESTGGSYSNTCLYFDEDENLYGINCTD